MNSVSNTKRISLNCKATGLLIPILTDSDCLPMAQKGLILKIPAANRPVIEGTSG